MYFYLPQLSFHFQTLGPIPDIPESLQIDAVTSHPGTHPVRY